MVNKAFYLRVGLLLSALSIGGFQVGLNAAKETDVIGKISQKTAKDGYALLVVFQVYNEHSYKTDTLAYVLYDPKNKLNSTVYMKTSSVSPNPSLADEKWGKVKNWDNCYMTVRVNDSYGHAKCSDWTGSLSDSSLTKDILNSLVINFIEDEGSVSVSVAGK